MDVGKNTFRDRPVYCWLFLFVSECTLKIVFVSARLTFYSRPIGVAIECPRVCRHRHLGGAVRLIGNFDRPNLRFGVRLKAESEKAHQAEVAAVVRTPGKYFKPPIDHAAGSAISQCGPQCGRDDRHGGLRARALFKRRKMREFGGQTV